MSAHTPGPWKVEGNGVSAHQNAGDPRMEYWIVEEVNGNRTATALTGRPSDNARLIAAAPDLLEAACHALSALRENPNSPMTSSEVMLDLAIGKAIQSNT